LNLQASDLKGKVIEALKETEIARAKTYLDSVPVRAYSTSSICTPARSALYTGMYPIKNGAHPNHSGLNKDIPSMPNIMRDLGYKTGLVGKEGVHKYPTRPTNLFTWDMCFPHTNTPREYR
jgi:arylsulfatase A-like enzyme